MDKCTEKVLYESADFRITLRNTGCDMLVVAFSPMHWPNQYKKDRYWGDAVARKLPFSWLSIDALAEHWFCEEKWLVIAELVRDITQRFRIRIGYGHSMGGYAALKRSRDYLPEKILAFAPQCSINPDDVGHFDTRYIRAFNPNLHKRMKLQPSDICARSFIFFDSRFSTDRKHVLEIRGDNISYISIGYMSHDVIFVAKGAVSLAYLFMRAIMDGFDDVREMRRYLCAKKKTNQIYFSHLTYKAFKSGHARWAVNISNRALQLDATNSRVAIVKLQACMQLNLKEEAQLTVDQIDIAKLSDGDIVIVAGVLFNLGQKERALDIMINSSIEDGKNTKNLRALANMFLNFGRLDRAVELLERAVMLDPKDSHCLSHLAKGLMKNKDHPSYDLPRAVFLLECATKISPGVVAFWKSYAFALEISGDSVGAFSAWLQVKKMSGIESKDYIRFEALQSIVLGVIKR